MKHKGVRLAICVLAAFIALTAIGGGIAMLTGADQFPLEWLRNTPFIDFTIPALVLAIVVGGSSLVAAVTIFTGREVGMLASVAAGLVVAGWIVVEVVTINAPKPSRIEGLYFGLGLVVFGLAAYLWIAEYRHLPGHTKAGEYAGGVKNSEKNESTLRGKYDER